jgi:hypothetical protein
MDNIHGAFRLIVELDFEKDATIVIAKWQTRTGIDLDRMRIVLLHERHRRPRFLGSFVGRIVERSMGTSTAKTKSAALSMLGVGRPVS